METSIVLIAIGLVLVLPVCAYVFRTELGLVRHHKKLRTQQSEIELSRKFDDIDLAILEAVKETPRATVDGLIKKLAPAFSNEHAVRTSIFLHIQRLAKVGYIDLFAPAPINMTVAGTYISESMECTLTKIGNRQLDQMLCARHRVMIHQKIPA